MDRHQDMSVSVTLQKVLALARTKFLLYSPIAFMTGCSFAFSTCPEVDLGPDRLLGGLAITYTAHVMTHFINEFYDLVPDRLNKNPSPWTGGSRVLANGELAPSTSLGLGYFLMGLLVVCASVLLPNSAARTVLWAIIIGAWGYSAPPLRLQGRGLGETTVAVVLNVLTPLLGFFIVQGQNFALPGASMLSTLFFNAYIEHSRMMVMNMADVESDATAGKKTLVVRLGIENAKVLYKFELLSAYALLLPLTAFGQLPEVTALLFVLTFPCAVLQARTVLRSDWDAPFWASQFNACCMGMAFIGTFFLNEFSKQSILRSRFLILFPLVPIAIVQQAHIRLALTLRLDHVKTVKKP
jgi:1,4-dihydroxy-2-naphthoate octaprenyltransferase